MNTLELENRLRENNWDYVLAGNVLTVNLDDGRLECTFTDEDFFFIFMTKEEVTEGGIIPPHLAKPMAEARAEEKRKVLQAVKTLTYRQTETSGVESVRGTLNNISFMSKTFEFHAGPSPHVFYSCLIGFYNEVRHMLQKMEDFLEICSIMKDQEG